MISSESLKYGCDRVDAFAAVNYHRKGEDRQKAMEVFLESLGLTDELQTQLEDWAYGALGDDAESGAITMGIIIGLFAAEHGSS